MAALTAMAATTVTIVATAEPAHAVAPYCSPGVTGPPWLNEGSDGLYVQGGTYFARAAYCQTGDTKLHMQSDGNLVIVNLATGRAIWGAGTNTRGGVRAVFQRDGNLVVLNSSSRPVWSSGTCCNADLLVVRPVRRVQILRTYYGPVIWSKP